MSQSSRVSKPAEEYRLLPGAVAEFVCTNPDCEKPHVATLPDGLEIETYWSACPFCKKDTAEIVDVRKEGKLR